MSRQQLLMLPVFVIVVLILVAGCTEVPANNTTTTPAIHSPSTPTIHYPLTPVLSEHKINETVTDGDLRITVVKVWDNGPVTTNTRNYNVEVILENVNPEKKIRVTGEDFSLYDFGQTEYLHPSQGSGDAGDLDPGIPATRVLAFTVPSKEEHWKLFVNFQKFRENQERGLTRYFNLTCP